MKLSITRQLHTVTKQRSTCVRNLHSAKHVYQVFDESRHSKPTSLSSRPNFLHVNLSFNAFGKLKELLGSGMVNDIDEVTVALALKDSCRNLKHGVQVHKFAIVSGLTSFITVPNSLMNMYSKSGMFDKALSIFEDLFHPDIVSWNTLLSGFEKSEEALNFVSRMNLSGMAFDAVTCTTALSFCLDLEGFIFGFQLHSLAMKSGLVGEVFVGNALITMYSRWKCLEEAQRVFDEMLHRDLVTWNAMLSGFSQDKSYGLEAISVFIEMVRQSMKLDNVSFSGAVSACGYQRNLEVGRQIHGLCIKRGYGSHVSVCNVLISMYAKCEVDEDAKLVFERMTERNVISWTTMISIDEMNAIRLFNDMRLDGVYYNDVTFVGLISAITTRNLVEEGQTVHACCVKSNFLSESNVCNSLITMYAKFELVQDSIKVFEELDCREVVSWNALISGYAQNGMFQESLRMFLSAITECKPNEFTFGSVLSAIGSGEDVSLKHGQRCHSYLIKLGFSSSPIVCNALLDMYAKRGSISESQKVFSETHEKGQFSWTSIISAYARHGSYDMVMTSFQEMKKEGIKPDSITFLSVLTACCRNGMVDIGRELFDSMLTEYQIEPSSEHYSCMVDMLGRAGRLNEAEKLMSCSPGGPVLSMLQSLLGACTKHGNVAMGERVADALMEMEPNESGPYVLMSNLYAKKGYWEKVAKVRRMMRERGVRKEVGFSWVDVGDINGSLSLHGFSSADKSHPLSEEIYRMAECLGLEMTLLREEGQKVGCKLVIVYNI